MVAYFCFCFGTLKIIPFHKYPRKFLACEKYSVYFAIVLLVFHSFKFSCYLQLCKESFSNEENKDGDEPWDSKLDWKPLNFLVEVANRTKPPKSSASQGSGSKSEHALASRNQFQGSKTKTKDKKSKCKREDEKSNNGDPTTSETATPKRLRRTRRKRSATTFGDSRNLSQPDESSAKQESRNGPVWFSLVTFNDK